MTNWLYCQTPEMRERESVFDYISKRGRVGEESGIRFIIHTAENGAYRTKCVSTLGASAQVDAPFSAV